MNFNMLRACFWLLAAILLVQSVDTSLGALTCYYLFIESIAKIGDCSGYGDRVNTIWAEMLATVLALLLAARGGPPPDDKEPK
jgi:hypothetical protein